MALRSTGGNGYINFGYNNFPNFESAKTISFWYNTTGYTATYAYFNIFNTSSSRALQFGSRSDAQQLIAWRWGGGVIVNSNLTPSTGNIHHCAYTYDGVNVSTIYVDGAYANTNTDTEASGAVTGVQFFGNAYAENGVVTLEDFRIYNRAMSAHEIVTIYNCRGYDSIFYGLVSRWLFKGQSDGTHPGAATALKDLTINGNNGISFSNAGTDYTYTESQIRFHRGATQ